MSLLLADDDRWWSLFDSDWIGIVLRTVQVSGTAVSIALVLGIPLGLMLGRSQHWVSQLLLVITRIAMAMPPVAVGLVLYLLLSHKGLLSDLHWLFTWKAMVVAQVVLILPYPIAILAQSLRALPPLFIRQLLGLGASRLQVAQLVLRQLRGALILAISTALARSLSEVGAVLIVGGNVRHSTRVLTTAIVQESSQGQTSAALWLAIMLMALATAANLPLIFWSRERVS